MNRYHKSTRSARESGFLLAKKGVGIMGILVAYLKGIGPDGIARDGSVNHVKGLFGDRSVATAKGGSVVIEFSCITPSGLRFSNLAIPYIEEMEYTEWTLMTPRECGEYGLEGGASAILEMCEQPTSATGTAKTKMSLVVLGKSIEDIVKLVSAIKAGEIRPEKSYDNPQDGPSRKELLAELENLGARHSDQKEEVQRQLDAEYKVKEFYRTSFLGLISEVKHLADHVNWFYRLLLVITGLDAMIKKIVERRRADEDRGIDSIIWPKN